jgi:hypothetical protein
MGRARERVCLQDGLKLDLSLLCRDGFIKRGANIDSCGNPVDAFTLGRNCQWLD